MNAPLDVICRSLAEEKEVLVLLGGSSDWYIGVLVILSSSGLIGGTAYC
jgi:hypothetical protein